MPPATDGDAAASSSDNDSSSSSSNDNKNYLSLNGSGIVNSTNDDTIFWEKAHIATCLRHATIAFSCEQVYKESSWTAMNDFKNGHTGEDEVLLKVCNILGSNDVCAYIRWDGSIANDDDETKLFNDRRNYYPPSDARRQMITPTRHCTAVEIECKMTSNYSGGAHHAATSAEETNYMKFHNIRDTSSMLSAMNQRQVEQLARLSGMYLTDMKGERGRTLLVDNDSINPTTTTAITMPTPPTITETSSYWSILRHLPIIGNTSLFQILKSSAARVIHGALSVIEGAEESDQYFDAIGGHGGGGYHNHHDESSLDESSSLQVRELLTKDVASEPRIAAAATTTTTNDIFGYEDDDDTTTLTGRGRTKQQQQHGEQGNNNNNMPVLLPPVSSDDMLISIAVVAYACRHLLTFAQGVISSRCGAEGVGKGDDDVVGIGRAANECNNDYSAFFVPMPDGDARIMLHREGWDACSFGMFCRMAGSYFASFNSRDAATCVAATTASPFTVSTMTEWQTLAQYGKILLGMTREEVNLLATTLCKSNFALVEKDIIILFPGGIPVDDYSHHLPVATPTPTSISSSDFALFQIHVTKISVQKKIVRLERHANVAKNDAIKARRDNKDTSELALMHMRRRKAALDELERCSSLLSNLDACELRLERARDDVRLVKSYAYLRTALQDVRKSRDEVLMGSNSSYEDVEELMLVIREEMDEMNEMNREMNRVLTIDQYDEIDEAELSEEFRRFELECESSTDQEQSRSGVREVRMSGQKRRLDRLPTPTMGQQNEEPKASEPQLPA